MAKKHKGPGKANREGISLFELTEMYSSLIADNGLASGARS